MSPTDTRGRLGYPPDDPHRRSRAASSRGFLLLVVIVSSGACSTSGGSSARSLTPRITSAKLGAKSSANLMTEQDVRSVDAFAGARAQDLASVPVFENPDLRGPCGGHVSGLSFKGGVGRAFATTSRQLVQIGIPTTDGLQHYLSAAQADVRSPCLPYDSQTNTGASQHVSDIHVVDLRKIGVPGLAWRSTITETGNSISGGAIVIGTKNTFVFLQFVGRASLGDQSIAALARRALKRVKT